MNRVTTLPRRIHCPWRLRPDKTGGVDASTQTFLFLEPLWI